MLPEDFEPHHYISDRSAHFRLRRRVTAEPAQGPINYAAVPDFRGVDLEPYRNVAVEVVRIFLAGKASSESHLGLRNLLYAERNRNEIKFPYEIPGDRGFRLRADAHGAPLVAQKARVGAVPSGHVRSWLFVPRIRRSRRTDHPIVFQ